VADRSVLYTLAYRGWQLLAGAVTLALLGRHLSPVEQGVYFTFASLTGLQVLFELGLSVVVAQFASHEMANLRWTAGVLRGDVAAKARLRALVRGSLGWYGAAALLMLGVVAPLGTALMRMRPETAQVLNWPSSWLWLVAATAGLLAVSPLFAVLEGCDRVADVARFRVWHDVLGYGAFWAALVAGAGVAAYPILQLVRLALSAAWLTWETRAVWRDLACNAAAAIAPLDWRGEVWPMQWRIALSWTSGYFIFQLVNPIAFASLGPVAAGQLGLTLALTGAVTNMAASWLTTRAPEFGQLIAGRRFADLDALFARSLRRALVVAAAGGVGVLGVVRLLPLWDEGWRARFVDPFAATLLALAAVANVAIVGIATYLRAHKEEPLVVNSVIGALLTPPALYAGAIAAGARGMAVAFALLTGGLGLAWAAWTFRARRQAWQGRVVECV
jgi:hypothetical protein